jgi:hypothetical protein
MQWEINAQARAPIGVATIDPAATCLVAPAHRNRFISHKREVFARNWGGKNVK